MSSFDKVEAAPRRVMTLIFLVDTSGSMEGERIGQVNDAIENIIPEINDISSSNADAEIKIAVLEFSSGIEWMYPEPISTEDFTWQNLEAAGLTSMGEAFKELNTKLSRTTGFMKEAAGSFAPAIIMLSDGEPTDDYKHALEKLKANNWFKAGIKVAIAIGDDANKDILADFTGNKESVLTVHNREQLKKIIRFVSVTASQVASSHSSVGKEAPATKQEEFVDKMNDADNTSDTFDGVDIGDETTNAGTDDWGTF
ncbi:vWA domain-containing protein [Xylanibacter rodentium]|uniref:vWA domain-containing protein n=1 Tax=Xylanibacter rodentium TaxID=2736289 RepID=UPI002582F849|nr:VWA domain-containing protein [Xylanibacter rodentium]